MRNAGGSEALIADWSGQAERMGKFTALRIAFACAGMTAWVHPIMAQPRHGENVLIGRSSSGQLLAEFDPDVVTELHALPSGDTFSGWADDGPGFQSLPADEPHEDYFSLPEGARLRFEVLHADDAFAAVDGATFELLDEPGENKFLGPAPFEAHVLWLINSADPSFDPGQTVWTIELRLLDDDGAFAPSDAFTLSFTKVPEPSTVTWALSMGFCVVNYRPRRVLRTDALGRFK